jgi:hypothetical protein
MQFFFAHCSLFMSAIEIVYQVTFCWGLGETANQREVVGLKSPPPKQRSLTRKSNSDVSGSRDDLACSPGSQPRVLTDFSGWFASPNFGASYPNDANCQWLIVSQSQVGRNSIFTNVIFEWIVLSTYATDSIITDRTLNLFQRTTNVEDLYSAGLRWTRKHQRIRQVSNSYTCSFNLVSR